MHVSMCAKIYIYTFVSPFPQETVATILNCSHLKFAQGNVHVLKETQKLNSFLHKEKKKAVCRLPHLLPG